MTLSITELGLGAQLPPPLPALQQISIVDGRSGDQFWREHAQLHCLVAQHRRSERISFHLNPAKAHFKSNRHGHFACFCLCYKRICYQVVGVNTGYHGLTKWRPFDWMRN
ncbi:hypothetical protein V6N13_105941 [Hibiscus sabdariffa]|uniref:Uncharacterized protein n=1 Tax=Hibiscus sabdariffa TaxID=183260 RepID=A0ABR2EZ70_9ROSI